MRRWRQRLAPQHFQFSYVHSVCTARESSSNWTLVRLERAVAVAEEHPHASDPQEHRGSHNACAPSVRQSGPTEGAFTSAHFTYSTIYTMPTKHNA